MSLRPGLPLLLVYAKRSLGLPVDMLTPDDKLQHINACPELHDPPMVSADHLARCLPSNTQLAVQFSIGQGNALQ